MDLHSGNRGWESLRLSQTAPVELECFVVNDSNYHRFHVSLPEEYPETARDLQMHVVDILLKSMGGDAEDMATHHRFNAPEFAVQMLFQKRPLLPFTWKSLQWPLFSWLTTSFGAGVFFFGKPEAKLPALALALIAFLCSVGLTLYLKKDD